MSELCSEPYPDDLKIGDMTYPANTLTWGKAYAIKTLCNAIKGNGTCVKETFGRLDGPIPHKIEGSMDVPKKAELTDEEGQRLIQGAFRRVLGHAIKDTTLSDLTKKELTAWLQKYRVTVVADES